MLFANGITGSGSTQGFNVLALSEAAGVAAIVCEDCPRTTVPARSKPVWPRKLRRVINRSDLKISRINKKSGARPQRPRPLTEISEVLEQELGNRQRHRRRCVGRFAGRRVEEELRVCRVEVEVEHEVQRSRVAVEGSCTNPFAA